MSEIYSISKVQLHLTRLFEQQQIYFSSSSSLFSALALLARPSGTWLTEVLTTAFTRHVQFNGTAETRHLNTCQGVHVKGYFLSVNMFASYFQFQNDFLSGETLLITTVIS